MIAMALKEDKTGNFLTIKWSEKDKVELSQVIICPPNKVRGRSLDEDEHKQYGWIADVNQGVRNVLLKVKLGDTFKANFKRITAPGSTRYNDLYDTLLYLLGKDKNSKDSELNKLKTEGLATEIIKRSYNLLDYICKICDNVVKIERDNVKNKIKCHMCGIEACPCIKDLYGLTYLCPLCEMKTEELCKMPDWFVKKNSQIKSLSVR